jgi:N-hydroxyarylamine O-acetyltransferase
MQIEKYFDRIKYNGSPTPCFELLKQLQQQHLLNIPFENLDIHWKIPIELDTDKIFDKIVNKKRGGFCYELNSLFYMLLVSIGFEARMISARVYDNNVKEFGREYDHLAIIVRLEDNDWLVDVGFGEFSFSPLRIVPDEIKSDKRGRFMITKKQQDALIVNKASGNEWVPEYLFTLRDRRLSEFEEMCRFHQFSPESHFTGKRVCSVLTDGGKRRISISDNKIKVTGINGAKEIPIGDDAEFEKLLWKYFKIKAKLPGLEL